MPETVDITKVPYAEMLDYLQKHPELVQAAQPKKVDPQPEKKKIDLTPPVLEVKEGESFEDYNKRVNAANAEFAKKVQEALDQTEQNVTAAAQAEKQQEVDRQVQEIQAKAEHWTELLPVTESLWKSGKYEKVADAYTAALKAEGLEDKGFVEPSKTEKTPVKTTPKSTPKKSSTVHPDESKPSSQVKEELESTVQGKSTRETAAEHLQAYMADKGLSEADFQSIENKPPDIK